MEKKELKEVRCKCGGRIVVVVDDKKSVSFACTKCGDIWGSGSSNYLPFPVNIDMPEDWVVWDNERLYRFDRKTGEYVDRTK